MSLSSINFASALSPIDSPEINQSKVQFKPDELQNQINNILTDGIKNHSSKDFMTDQILTLLNQNPDTAKELKIEPDFQRIKKDIVEPAVTFKWCSNDDNSSLAISRRTQILNQQVCQFEIKSNPNADGSKPFFELHSQSEVQEYNQIIEDECKKQGVDPNLAKAIMYMETTHGYYDFIFGNTFNKSIRPMNINAGFWHHLGYSREDLKNPEINIKVGVYLLKQISMRVPDKSIDKIATLYNDSGATTVSKYGARILDIYRNQLWRN